jgi:2-polyprenyl-6-methoxyphenol hydroxylase-like FAD-dependent oxidoreductase
MTGRAIVIGAGMAGLVAARVLSDHLDEVVLVERDRLADLRDEDGQPIDRPGVPQGPHLHVLLARGHGELMRLYPEWDARLAAAGAGPIDWPLDACWVTGAGTAPRFHSRLRSRLASRALFERTLRDLTLARPGITLLDGHEAEDLLVDGGEVRGAVVRARPTTPDSTPGDPRELAGWLVVDASGRSSKTPDHLASVGLPAPRETVIDASLRYSTRHFRAPARKPDWKVLLVRDRIPSGTRGGGITPIEGDRWIVTLGGAVGDHPPTDEAGYGAFASSLLSPMLADAIRDAEPIGPVRGWARTSNRWRHVESMASWPRGLALVGDALCALNPVYGQGMSVAAMEGPVLGSWLVSEPVRRAKSSGSPPDTLGLMRSIAGTARLPWFLSTAEDARILGATGAPPVGLGERLSRRYVDAVYANASRHQPTARRFIEVTQLRRPPLALFDPLVAFEVARTLIGQRVGRVSGPV